MLAYEGSTLRKKRMMHTSLKQQYKGMKVVREGTLENNIPVKTRSQGKSQDKKGPTILQVLPAMETGGAEQGALDISAELVKAGSRSFIACNGGPRAYEIERGGGKMMTLPVDSKNPAKIYRNINKLVRIIEDYDIDLVHARSRAPAWSAYYACRKTGTPFVTTCHAPYNTGSALKKAYNKIMACGDEVIAISEHVKNYLTRHYNLNEDKVRVIHRGIPVEHFHPTSVTPERMIQLSRQWRLPEDAGVILLPGRLTRWKGQRIMIEAMSKIQNSHAFCVILGSDQGRTKYSRELARLIEEYGVQDKIRMVENCRDMPAAYMLSTIVVSASTDPEGFGRVPVEAQAMGRIAIATDHGGAAETIISGETGWLVPPGNATALASAIDRALEMPESERVKMATRAMAHVEKNFTKEKMVNETFDVYAQLLKKT